MGETAVKTKDVIKSAMDGILFIDEAYTLAGADPAHTDSFGLEAINTLLKEMEDNRERLVVILTKLDGTAKGGVVIGIRSEFDLPVKLIGTGEQIDDMEYFDAKEFGRALFSGDDDVFQSEAEEFIEDVKEEIAETVADIKEDVAELKADVQIAAEIIKEEAAERKAETQTLVEEIVEDIKEEAAEWKAEAEEFVTDVQEEIADLMDAPQADDLDEYNDVQEAEDKPKKKGFFGGLFGGRK